MNHEVAVLGTVDESAREDRRRATTAGWRLATAARYGGGGVGALGALGAAAYAVLAAEARLARRWILQRSTDTGPDASGWYGHGPGAPLELAMLGDSSAVGLGVEHPQQTPGAVLATGLAAFTGRPVRLTVVAVVGAQSAHLGGQIDRLLAEQPRPQVAVIMIGANDVTHRVSATAAARALHQAVLRLREEGAEVVVGTAPDLGTIEPIAQPLRYVARRLSRRLAAAQTVAVIEAGGRTVSLGDLLGPEFSASPAEMFSPDRFHPSAAGYARAAAALLPSVTAALGAPPGGWPAVPVPHRLDLRAGEGVDDVAHAAARAVAAPGTEVSGAEVHGAERGPRGRWAMLRRRRTAPAPLASPPGPPPAPPASPPGPPPEPPAGPPAPPPGHQAAAGAAQGEAPAGTRPPEQPEAAPSAAGDEAVTGE